MYVYISKLDSFLLTNFAEHSKKILMQKYQSYNSF